MQLAAEAVAAGDVSAITPYFKVLDRLDRYQTVAVGHQVYDDEARKKLMDKINRMAANFGVDEVMAAAAYAHLIKIGAIPLTSRARPMGRKIRQARPKIRQARPKIRRARLKDDKEGQNEAANWMSV
jgi:hypothetical protein